MDKDFLHTRLQQLLHTETDVKLKERHMCKVMCVDTKRKLLSTLMLIVSISLSLSSLSPSSTRQWRHPSLSIFKAINASFLSLSLILRLLWVGFWHDNQAKKSPIRGRVWRTCGRGWGPQANPPSQPIQAQLLSLNATQIRNIGALVPPPQYFSFIFPFSRF